MKAGMFAVLFAFAMVASASADIVPSDPATAAASTKAVSAVQSQMVNHGVSTTESRRITESLTPDQIEFLAASNRRSAVAGALLPEEWLGAALWFYVLVPKIETNIRRYIMHDDTNQFFDWEPFKW